MKLKGILPAIVTPVTDSEEVDEKGLRNVIKYEIEAGVHGIFVLGSMGAFDLLTGKEKVKAIEITCDEVKGNIPVMAGISDTSVKRVIENASSIKGLPIDYYSVMSPYMANLSQNEIKIFYTEIAKSVKKPVIMYNSPQHVSFMTPDTIKELSEIPNIVGVKDCYEDINLYRLSEYFKDKEDFTYIVGTEIFAFEALASGANGVIGGILGLGAKIAVDMYNSIICGDYRRAFECQERIIGLVKIADYGDIWGGVEAAFRILRICNKFCAAPRHSLDNEDELSEIKNILDKYYYN